MKSHKSSASDVSALRFGKVLKIAYISPNESFDKGIVIDFFLHAWLDKLRRRLFLQALLLLRHVRGAVVIFPEHIIYWVRLHETKQLLLSALKLNNSFNTFKLDSLSECFWLLLSG